MVLYLLVATVTCPSLGPPPADLDGPCLEDLTGAEDVDIGRVLKLLHPCSLTRRLRLSGCLAPLPRRGGGRGGCVGCVRRGCVRSCW